MKIFISYSRDDGGDFANQIQRHLSSFEHDIFTDVNNIRAGEVWSNTIEINISNCNIFVVIVTKGAIQSPHVEREVLQAQKENKTIIPCFYKDVIDSDIKWGLDKIQGVEFSDKYELARNVHSEIANMSRKGIVTLPSLENINTLINNGDILYDQAKYPEAIEWYDKVLRIDPNNESVHHKRFQAIQHLPKSSYKIYSNVKIRTKTLTEELISYLQQKNFNVICNPDYKNNMYFINANKLSKMSKLMPHSDQINIKIRDHLSNLEIFLLFFAGVLGKIMAATGSFSLLSTVAIASFSAASMVAAPVAAPFVAIPLIQHYANHKLKKEIWKFIEQKIS